VDAEFTFLDHSFDLRESEVCGVILFECAARDKTQIVDSEDNRIEDRTVACVKGTVDENVVTF
jgi:hypothetical protein